jgi:hypothetical protein
MALPRLAPYALAVPRHGNLFAIAIPYPTIKVLFPSHNVQCVGRVITSW